MPRTVVLTGASSGIGRATARAFAERGDRVVLIARRADLLDEVAEECRAAGGDALPLPGDVTDAGVHEEAVARATEAFGGLDVWVNNASVLAVGRFERTPVETFRRVLETNVLGCVVGARAAVAAFRERGGRGVIINNASVLGTVGAPYLSAYCASKFAIRGLGQCLRQELSDTQIKVCTLLPATIDTPIWRHAANYTRAPIRPIPPVYPPRLAADAIVSLAERPRREVVVGSFGWLMRVSHLVIHPLYEHMARFLTERSFQGIEVPVSDGNVFEPMTDGRTAHGGWHVDMKR